MRNWALVAAVSTLLLSGCSPVEYQSDLPEKKPLVALDTKMHVTKKWTASTGRGVGKNDIKLSLVQAGPNLISADYSGEVTAVNANTGVNVWTSKLNVPISAGPAFGDGKLIFGTNNGKIVAVDAATGKLIWTSITTSEVLAAPRIADGMVYVNTMDGGLSALALSDGRQVWRFTHNLPPLVLRRGSTPVVTHEHVIAGFASGKLIAIRKGDGTVDWAQDVAHPKGTTDLQRMVDISADPILKDNVVYVASYQGNLAAISATSGNIIWDRDVASYSGFVIDPKFIYVSATNGDVVAMDIKTGGTFWLQPALQGRMLSKPVIMNNYIVVADDDGYVHWLDKNTGKLVGRFQLDKGGVEATPIIHNNIAYILGRSGKLVAVEVS
jgi:outer membrane protein assembly factor BamB